MGIESSGRGSDDRELELHEEATRQFVEFGILPEPAIPPDRQLTAEELLGRGVLRLRLYFRWSQRDLERRSGVDQSTTCRLETGRGSNLGSRRMCAILKALRVSDVTFLPPPTETPTTLELMLRGDPWERALREADKRIKARGVSRRRIA